MSFAARSRIVVACLVWICGALAAFGSDDPSAQIRSKDASVRIHALTSCTADDFQAEDTSALIDLISDSDVKVRLAALDFWAAHGREWQTLEEEEWNDPREPRHEPPPSELAESLINAIVASSADKSLAKNALRALCSFEVDVQQLCAPGSSGFPTRSFSGPRERARGAIERIANERPEDLRSALAGASCSQKLAAYQWPPSDQPKFWQPEVNRLLVSRDRLDRIVGILCFDIGQRNTPHALDTLGPLLDDPDADVVDWATDELRYEDLAGSYLGTHREQLSSSLLAVIPDLWSPPDNADQVAMAGYLLRNSTSPAVRAAGAWMQARSGSQVSERLLVPLLRDPDPRARLDALKALTLTWNQARGDPDWIGALCTDSDMQVRSIACQFACESESRKVLEAAVSGLEMGVGFKLFPANLGEPSRPFLELAAASNSSEARYRAAVGLFRRVDEPWAVELLLRLAHDASPEVLSEVILDLTRSSAPEAIEELGAMVRRTEGRTRAEALLAMRSDGSLEDISWIKQFLKDRSRAVRHCTREAIRSIRARYTAPPELVLAGM